MRSRWKVLMKKNENERIKKKNKREITTQLFCFVCTNDEKKENVHLTNLRECRISAVREKKRKKRHKEQINKTQDNEIKDLKLNRGKKKMLFFCWRWQMQFVHRKKKKKRKRRNSENCTTSTVCFFLLWFSF